MAQLKHVGRIKATNKKVLVAYRTLPGDAYNCLVVPTENMPDVYHDAIINLVESNAAQEAYEFAEALDRTQFPDGSRMLPWLHVNNRLVKVPTDAVEMTPTVQFGILLSELNQVIAEQRGIAVDELALTEGINDKKQELPAPAKPETPFVKKTIPDKRDKPAEASVTVAEPVVSAQLVVDPNNPDATAKLYRSQADKLAKEAAHYRRLAEELVPTKKKVK
jgi:hypothetical protein